MTVWILAAISFGLLADVSQSAPPEEMMTAAICFKSGEQEAGLNKICYYDCLGSTVAITISAIKLCPLTINN